MGLKAAVLAITVALLSALGLGLWLNRGGEEEKVSPEEQLQHMDQVMQDAGKLMSSAKISNGGLEIVEVEGDRKPFAIYTVTIQSPAKETYLFDSEEYILDIGSGVKTGELCETVKAATPQQIKKWIDSKTLDELQIDLTSGVVGVQIPVGALLEDLARLFGLLAREPETSFARLEIFVKGFADGNVAAWERNLEGYPYDFHEIAILPQLDPKNSVTPRKFLATPIKFQVPRTYRNEHLANLRGAFVAQDIVSPMLGSCLKDHSVSVGILEGYVSQRTKQNPRQRKVEIYLNFYS